MELLVLLIMLLVVVGVVIARRPPVLVRRPVSPFAVGRSLAPPGKDAGAARASGT